MFTKIIVKDFKRTKDVELDLNSRLVIISGVSGSGKSSILQALDYAENNRLDSKIEHYKRWGTSKFEIELSKQFEGIDYTTIINSKKSGADRQLTFVEDGEEKEYSNSVAVEKMDDIFNFNLTKNAIISHQRDTTKILFSSAPDRLKEFKNIFGLQKLKQAVDNISLEIKNIRTKMDKLKIEIEVLKKQEFPLCEIPENNIDISEITFEITKLDKEKTEYEQSLVLYETYKKELAQYISAVHEKQSLSNILINKKEEVLTLEKEFSIVKDEDILKLKSFLDIQLKDKIEYDRNFDKIKSDANYFNEISKLDKELKLELNEYKLERIKPLPFTKEDIQKVKDMLKEKEPILILSKNRYDSIVQGKCFNCGETFEKYTNEEKNREIQNYLSLENDIESHIKEIEALEKLYNNYNDAVNKNDLVKFKRESIQKQIDTNNKKLLNYKDLDESQIEVIENKIQRNEQAITNNKNQLESLEENKINNNNLNNTLYKLEVDIKAIETKMVEFDKLVKPIEVETTTKFDLSHYNEVKLIEKEYESLTNEIALLNKVNDDIELKAKENRKEITDKENLLIEYQKDHAIKNDSKKFLDKDFSSFVISEGTEFIKDEMNNFFQSVNGEYEVSYTSSDKGIDFYYQDEEHKIPTEFNLSGGLEADLLATAFRVSLCKVMGVDVFIADEIDKYADTEKALSLYNALLDVDYLNQLIVITHNERLKEELINYKDSISYEVKNGTIVNIY